MTGTDLQTTGHQGQPTPWCEPELPERLAMLVGEPLPERVPAISDGEEIAVLHALSIYDEHPKGTAPRQVNSMMTRLALAYPSARLSDAEAQGRMDLYAEMLSDIDSDILAAGFREAVKTCKFFPSISELRELALKQPATPRMVRMYRLRSLLRAHREQANLPAPVEIVTPEQIAAIKAEMGLTAEVSAQLDRIVGSEAA